MAETFKLDDVRPWGRNRAEYRAFFDLDAVAPGARILDCGGGPSSFNAEMTRLGYRVVSADPLYRFSPAGIARRIEATRGIMDAGLRAAREHFVWTHYGSPGRVTEIRLAAMRHFLEDYEVGRDEGRYLDAALPDLPLPDGGFDLVLCSHFLFLYGEQRDAAFHLACIREMARVGRAVRIFPLVDLEGAPSRHLAPLRTELDALGYETAVRRVDYEFQKGGNEMLCVRAAG